MSTNEKPILRSLNYLSSSYLESAKILSKRCFEIEGDIHPGNRTKLMNEHKAYFYGSVFNCIAYLESYINELFFDISEGNLYGINIEEKSVIQIQELWNLKIPRSASYRTTDKYQIILIISNKQKLDKSKSPSQDVDFLIKLRNSLIHYEPEYIESAFKNTDAKLHKYQKFLENKIEINPFATTLDNFYPTKIISYSFCQWAINSVSSYIKEFENKFFNKR